MTAKSTPLLDPDLIKPAELPDPTVGAAAIQLYQNRVDALESVVPTLAEKRQSAGFGSMLKYAFGDPGPAADVLLKLDKLAERLADPAKAHDAALELAADIQAVDR